jgi:hypothetical protein
VSFPSIERKTKLEYERIPLSDLKQGRRGKHRALVDGIMAELDALRDAEAMRIPLSSVTGVSLANLRSALNRAAKSAGLKTASFFDGESLFVWKKTPGTSQYERKRKKKA